MLRVFWLVLPGLEVEPEFIVGIINLKTTPDISIITPCLNRVEYVKEAIESVFLQDYVYVEHIFIDGGSMDGTLEVLQRYPQLRVISEPDKGIYDAINKGIRLAKGEIIGFLNTDDLYEPNIISSVVKLFGKSHDIWAVVGATNIFKVNSLDHKEIIYSGASINQDELLERITLGDCVFNAWFFNKRVFERCGLFNINYKYAADREFLIRFALEKIPYANMQNTVYHYRWHTGSITFSDSNNAESEYNVECRMIAKQYLKQEKLTARQKRVFLRWHNKLITNLVLFSLSQANISKARLYAYQGLKSGSWWIYDFIPDLFMSAVRVMKRTVGL